MMITRFPNTEGIDYRLVGLPGAIAHIQTGLTGPTTQYAGYGRNQRCRGRDGYGAGR